MICCPVLKAGVFMISWKKNLIFIWLSQICTVGGFSCVMPFIPLFIRHQFQVTGEAELGVQVSMFNFFGYLSFCAAAPLWGVLADRFGRKVMLLRACFISALLFPLIVCRSECVLADRGTVRHVGVFRHDHGDAGAHRDDDVGKAHGRRSRHTRHRVVVGESDRVHGRVGRGSLVRFFLRIPVRAAGASPCGLSCSCLC